MLHVSISLYTYDMDLVLNHPSGFSNLYILYNWTLMHIQWKS